MALTFLMTDAHFILSKALFLNLLTPMFLKSNSASSIPLNLDLPLFLLPPDLPYSNLFPGLVPSVLTARSSHSSLRDFSD